MDPEGTHGGKERRAQGLLRVPFIRRCTLEFDEGGAGTAFIVNINVLGAYVARDHVKPASDPVPSEDVSVVGAYELKQEMPELGQALTCRFSLPDSDQPLEVKGTVSWLNPRQQHPVHSLPPGFGVRFEPLPPEDRRSIENVVEDYERRNPQVSTS